MKPTTIPVICGTMLAAMSAAGLSHWWSVRQFVAAVDSGVPLAFASTTATGAKPRPVEASEKTSEQNPSPLAAKSTPSQNGPPTTHQKDFYEALIAKMESLQTQNRDLLDQVAETNRDLMKVEFRLDTHSESFRPLPVSEDRPFTRLDDSPGVLPPRAEPVALPTHE